MTTATNQVWGEGVSHCKPTCMFLLVLRYCSSGLREACIACELTGEVWGHTRHATAITTALLGGGTVCILLTFFHTGSAHCVREGGAFTCLRL